MLGWLTGTLMTACPFLIPVILFLIRRTRGWGCPAQVRLTWTALAAYAAAIVCFIVFAVNSGRGIDAFYGAFFLFAWDADRIARIGQVWLAVFVCLLFLALNWHGIGFWLDKFFPGKKKKED